MIWIKQGGKRTLVLPVDLLISSAPVAYPDAVAFMEHRVAQIQVGAAGECLWLLEHPALYTAGTSAKARDYLGTRDIPVYPAGRGGQYTYHGPGQRIAYLMLDLTTRGRDVRGFVSSIERWVGQALGEFALQPRTYPDRVGLWVDLPESREVHDAQNPQNARNSQRAEAKIAAIGVRLKRWVSLHGVAINVNPDLDHFGGIVPCGIADLGVTSLEDLGLPVAMTDLDVALIKHFQAAFDAPLTPAQSADI